MQNWSKQAHISHDDDYDEKSNIPTEKNPDFIKTADPEVNILQSLLTNVPSSRVRIPLGGVT